jgi:hypothetical protein
LLSFCCTFCTCGVAAQTNNVGQIAIVKAIMSDIPKDDRKEIQTFILTVFTPYDALAFSLFGNKPLSFTQCFCETVNAEQPLQNCLSGLFESTAQPYQKGLAAWQRHKNSFPTPNFTLLAIPHTFYLINHAALTQLVAQTPWLHQIAPELVNVEIFVELLRSDKVFASSFHNKLMTNHALLGTLLGFGHSNAIRYQRIADITWSETTPPFTSTRLLPNPPFQTIDEELQGLEEKSSVSPHVQWPPAKVWPVVFGSDTNDPESQQLISTYRTMQNELADLYSQKDSLFELIVLKLISKQK